ncbi:NmrA-like family domain-containing protein 1 [Grifola frondosa]|uniref:NmrA-like family domain-containing protein 1 n=1 Tax=Grifola frondosa TaxID=5627 RepID=A0A1C7LN67_GRIFR|nr:NmrA-like family domain-containing protein 1 [Grifola frondosa]
MVITATTDIVQVLSEWNVWAKGGLMNQPLVGRKTVVRRGNTAQVFCDAVLTGKRSPAAVNGDFSNSSYTAQMDFVRYSGTRNCIVMWRIFNPRALPPSPRLPWSDILTSSYSYHIGIKAVLVHGIFLHQYCTNMSSLTTSKKLILVIGATGAQGIVVIDKLLEPSTDGSPSPYAIRALTRDPKGRRSTDDFPSVYAALQGVYGAWVNTDGFTIGEAKEVFTGIRIFELAKQAKTVRHYVWSNLDYVADKVNYDPKYRVGHYDGKGRVADWMKSQPSIVSDNDMSWSVVTTGPYMDMLNNPMFGPLIRSADGTFIFPTPIGDGHVPMIALSDLGFFARYTFDHRAETSTKDLEVATDIVGWDYLVATFTRVTGKPARVLHQTIDEWFANLEDTDRPVANERPRGDGSTTWRQNFTGFWSLWHDDVIKRNMEWIRSINPNGHTLESWMRETRYTGNVGVDLLKNMEEGKMVDRLNYKRIAELASQA